MKFSEIKKLPRAELQEKVIEMKKEIIKENAQVAIGTPPKNPGNLRKTKKTIAKIKMALAMEVKKE